MRDNGPRLEFVNSFRLLILERLALGTLLQ